MKKEQKNEDWTISIVVAMLTTLLAKHKACFLLEFNTAFSKLKADDIKSTISNHQQHNPSLESFTNTICKDIQAMKKKLIVSEDNGKLRYRIVDLKSKNHQNKNSLPHRNIQCPQRRQKRLCFDIEFV